LKIFGAPLNKSLVSSAAVSQLQKKVERNSHEAHRSVRFSHINATALFPQLGFRHPLLHPLFLEFVALELKLSGRFSETEPQYWSPKFLATAKAVRPLLHQSSQRLVCAAD
jgi:hypothetical protein